jgi:hypothetical protein
MRRNASTVVVLAGPAPGEVLAALGRSMNVTLYRPERHHPERPAVQEGDGLAAAAEALQRAGRATSPYALVPADPLAALAAWRAGRFELPDYYLVLAREDTGGPDFYLGPLRSARAHRVVLVPEQEPGQQAAGVLHALGSLRHGPWWPGLDEVIDTARRFYPDSLAEGAATGPPPATPEAGRVRAG